MIQVKTSENGFELKNGTPKLVLEAEKISLGGLIVDESGEYEAEGIELVYGQQAALIAWNKLQLVYIFGPDKPSTFEKSQFSLCDVVIFSSALPNITKTFFNETLEQYEPNLVIVSARTDLDEIQSLIKTEPVELAKISDKTPEEGRELIVLR